MRLKSSLVLAYRNRLARPKPCALFIAAVLIACSLKVAAAQAPAPASQRGKGKEVRIAAAADLQTVMPPLAQRYEQETGVKLVVSYGSSGTLATQIINGQPVDLFLGADYTFPEKVVAAGLADSGAPTPYAMGTLVLWARNDSPLQPLHLEALSDTRVEKIAIANELHAPYGRAAASALAKLKLYDQLKPKLVIAENVAQAGQFVESGNAQLGFISLSMASSEHFRQLGTYVFVPTSTYAEIRQCAVVLLKSPHRTEAHAFLEWLLSSPIQSDLPKLGLNPVR